MLMFTARIKPACLDVIKNKMTTKNHVNPRNNGNLSHLLNRKFSVRILVRDKSSYQEIINYLEEISIESGMYGESPSHKLYYIFDKQKKQVAKADRSKRTIELTEESPEIKKGIEEIIYQTK